MPKSDKPAQLYRSRAREGEEVDHAQSELVGSGSLEKMVRVAMTDPDGELWRYSIRCGEQLLIGLGITAEES